MIRKFKFFEGIIEGTYVFDVQTNQIHGEARRLRATWSPELDTDLSAYHSIDAEAELTRILLDEIDNSIVDELRNFAENELLERTTDQLNNDIRENLNYLHHWINLGGNYRA